MNINWQILRHHIGQIDISENISELCQNSENSKNATFNLQIQLVDTRAQEKWNYVWEGISISQPINRIKKRDNIAKTQDKNLIWNENENCFGQIENNEKQEKQKKICFKVFFINFQ